MITAGRKDLMLQYKEKVFAGWREALYLSTKIVEYMKAYVAIMVVLLAVCCSSKKEMTAAEEATYREEIDRWHVERLEKVKAPNGWLNLVGLYWLEPGINTFGSDAGNA